MTRAMIPKPRSLAQRHARAIENALNGAAQGAQADFEVTTATWKTPITFAIQVIDPETRVIGTSDTIYKYVNDGTKAHAIRAKKPGGRLAFGVPSTPKTQPRIIRSGGGASGPVVYRREVWHPGTKPRDFSQTIAEKWQKQLPILLQRAILAELT